jgi:predicted acetylornithine/succinylornithine family transaminase
MGAALEQAKKADAACTIQTYARKPVMFVSGSGMTLVDDDGKTYLDFVSGIGAVNLGHAHPAVTAAIGEQAAKLVHVSNLYYVEHRAELACELAGLLGGGMKAFLCNSGAEANEGAFKLARRWAAENKPGAYKVVSAIGSFHGRTLATLAATGQPAKNAAFAPLPQGFEHVAFNDVDALEGALDETVAALMLEVVQGEGGVWPASAEYLEAAQRLCSERNVLLMFDEVQTGCFRTGPAFAHQAFGLEPDVVTVAKSVANGLPVGAVLAKDAVAAAFKVGDHGSTFAGGPVVCAAGLATLKALQTLDLGANAVEVGGYLVESLSALKDSGAAIVDVRGAGLIVGATLAAPVAAEVVAELLGKGFVVNNIGTDILRFLPPLICSKSDVDAVVSALGEVLEGVVA